MLSICGSFVATTANHIRLADGGHFDAVDQGLAPLTTASPAAFGFLPDNHGAISVLGKLDISGAKTVSLIGGDVKMDGAEIDVPNGALHVISARGNGEVQMDFQAARPQPVANPNLTRGDVNISNSTLGGSFTTKQVIIRGGKLVLAGANVFASATNPGDGIAVQATGDLQMDGGAIYASADGNLKGQAVVELRADSATLKGGAYVAASTGEFGTGGDVHFSIAGKLELSLAFVVAAAAEKTSGGDVRIDAGSMTASSDSAVFIQPSFSGISQGGNVYVTVADRVELLSGAYLGVNQTAASTSNVFVRARDVFISGAGESTQRSTGIVARLFAEEGTHGGLIHLDVSGTLEIRDGGVIDAQTAGVDGARIEIAAGGVLIDGRGDAPFTGINAQNKNAPGGTGGVVQLAVRDAVQLLNGGVISTNTTGFGGGGNITIAAGQILVEGKGIAHNSQVVQGITSRNQSSDVSGPGGDIRLEVRDSLELRRGAEITATTVGSGHGGNIAIIGGKISVGGDGLIAAESSADATGAGGGVSVTTGGTLAIDTGGRISVATRGAGPGGSIAIAADTLEMSGLGSAILATTAGGGSGGSISIVGKTGSLSGGSMVAAETTAAQAAGAGGDLHLAFDDTLTISGGSRISVATFGPGVGGSVEVRADQLVVTGNDSAVTAQSFGTPVGGDGGNIRLRLGELSIEDRGAILVSSEGSGRAGTITVEAARQVSLTGGSSITAAAPESSGGDIAISGGAHIELENSRITAEAKTKGGNIRLVSRDLLHLFESKVTAAAYTDGGNIFIDPQFVLLDRTQISANAVVGHGGNIQIFSGYFIASPDSLVTASSERGISGEVRINAINVDLTGNIVELPSTFIRAESLLRELCTVKLRDFSSFIVEGRGGMAPVPGEWLSSLEPELPHQDKPAGR